MCIFLCGLTSLRQGGFCLEFLSFFLLADLDRLILAFDQRTSKHFFFDVLGFLKEQIVNNYKYKHILFYLGNRLSSTNTSYLMGNLEEISSFQQMLVQSLEECTK